MQLLSLAAPVTSSSYQLLSRERARPSIAAYGLVSWKEANVLQTLYDAAGNLIRTEEFSGSETYNLDNTKVYVCWYSAPWTRQADSFLYKIKGPEGILQLVYGQGNADLVYDLKIISPEEMVCL